MTLANITSNGCCYRARFFFLLCVILNDECDQGVERLQSTSITNVQISVN